MVCVCGHDWTWHSREKLAEADEDVQALLADCFDRHSSAEESSTRLIAAAERNEPDVVVALLGRRANPNASGPTGTSLQHALKSKAWAVCHVLLESPMLGFGATVQAVRSSLMSMIDDSHDVEYAELVRHMALVGMDVHVPNSSGWTLLHCAALADAHLTVKVLLELQGNPNARASHATPLDLAFDSLSWRAATALLEVPSLCVDPTVALSHALGVVTSLGEPPPLLVRALLEMRADVDETDSGGYTLLLRAAENHMGNTMLSFLEFASCHAAATLPDGRSALHLLAPPAAIGDGKACLLAVRSLCNNGCDINALASNGATAFQVCVCSAVHEHEHRQAKLVGLMLEQCAEVGMTFSDGRTPLLLAIERQLWLIVSEILVHAPLHALAKLPDSRGALLLLAMPGTPRGEEGTARMVDQLCCARCSVNAGAEDGTTPLHAAWQVGYDELVRSLLACGVAIPLEDIHDRAMAFPVPRTA